MFPFDPPENIRKPLVFWCFQGDQKGTLGRKGLRRLGSEHASDEVVQGGVKIIELVIFFVLFGQVTNDFAIYRVSL